MSSPFVVPFTDRLCNEKKCEPFFIREWETMLIGALIVGSLLYLMCACGAENFTTKQNHVVYDRRIGQQAHFAVDDRPGHEGTRSDTFVPSYFTAGSIQTGMRYPSKGPSISRFADFAAIDAIDSLSKDEVNPSHQPETDDDTLEQIIR